MRRTVISLLIFGITFVAGLGLTKGPQRPQVSPKIEESQSFRQIPEPPPLLLAPPDPIEFTDLPEFEELLDEIQTGQLIDLSHTEGIYRESETVAKTGETWLVLTEKNSLVPAVAQVKKQRSVSYPGDENDVKVSFANIHRPILAMKGLRGVRPGVVDTLYVRPSDHEIERRNLPIDAMKTNFKREFNLGDIAYTLRVSRGKSMKGKTVGVLVLESDGVEQVIAQNYYDPAYGEIIGELRWVGDLDRDGKLDLYFDEYNEKGYSRVSLYLSSAAHEGKLVNRVAEFGMAGC